VYYLQCIVCYSPGGVLVAADYSQLELRVIAHLSADRKLLGILNSGGDVFKLIASQWKMVDTTDVTAEQRQQAKQVFYCFHFDWEVSSKFQHVTGFFCAVLLS